MVLNFALGLLASLQFGQTSQPSAEGPQPYAQWSFDPEGIDGHRVLDLRGRYHGVLPFSPRFTGKPSGGVEFRGRDDTVVLRAKATPVGDGLPQKAITLAAWVRIDKGEEYGGLLGMFQDNGPFEKGFVLGYAQETFSFGLASKGADDGDGKMTYLKGKAKFTPGKWNHVAATYDGATMKLFVNGKLDATSNEQKGDILYPPSAPFVIGAYKDANEHNPLRGAVKEVLLFDQAIDETNIRVVFARHAELLKLPAVGIAATPAADPAPLQRGVDMAYVDPDFTILPWIADVARDSVTFRWQCKERGDAFVEFGTSLPLRQKKAMRNTGPDFEFRLTDLQPGQTYFYRVLVRTKMERTLATELSTVLTAGEPSDAFSFALVGGTHSDPKTWSKIARVAWERRPHFLLHLGGLASEKGAPSEEFFTPAAGLLRRLPLVVTPALDDDRHRAVTHTPDWRSFQYGNAEFFLLHSGRDLSRGSEQIRWLRKTLTNSSAAWKVVCIHDSPYGDEPKDPPPIRRRLNPVENAREILPLIDEFQIDLAFHGNHRYYERTFPMKEGKPAESGIIHILSGSAAAPVEAVSDQPSRLRSEVRSDHHFCYVTVQGNRLSLKAFDAQGRLFDVLELRKEVRR